MKQLQIQDKTVYVSQDGKIIIVNNKILKQRLNKQTGYVVVSINNKTYYVHQLVCQAYHNKLNENLIVGHIDNDKTNNHADNLKWLTLSENNNTQHANELRRQYMYRTPRRFHKNQLIVAYNKSTNTIKHSFSATKLAKEINCSTVSIYRVANPNDYPKSIKGWKIFFLTINEK